MKSDRPVWVDSLLERFDRNIQALNELNESHGRLLGGHQDIRREVSRLTRAVESLQDAFQKEQTARRDEDLSIRQLVASQSDRVTQSEKHMNMRNAKAGGIAGAVVLILEAAFRAVSAGFGG